MFLEERALLDHLFRNFGDNGGGMYFAIDYADIDPCYKEFKRFGNNEAVPAFRWDKGKMYGTAMGFHLGNETEFLYLHLQKRAMKFTPGLENEDSFMIIPNEFVKDHDLTPEEIQQSITPDHEYESEMFAKYPGIFRRATKAELIKNFFKKDKASMIISIKNVFNSICRRRLDIV